MDPQNIVDIAGYLANPTAPEIELMRLHAGYESIVIFDIGSCEGEDSVRYAKRFPNSRIYAFEPLPGNQAIARANFARYALTNAELVPLALSDKAGEATFHVSSGRPSEEFAGKDWNYGNKSSSLLPPAGEAPMHGWIEFKESITVRTETLEAFARGRSITRIDFIHMDVQGAERLVLQGAAAMLPRIGAIWLEVSDEALYKGQALKGEIGRFMGEHGFSLAHEVMNGVEGDQLYVNRREPRSWGYLASKRAGAFLRKARFRAGAIKSRVLGRTPQP